MYPGTDADPVGPAPLPVALRAWGRIGRQLEIATRPRVAGRLSRLLIKSGETYAGAGGFQFSIDSEGRFQATMLVGLYDPICCR